MKRPSSTSKVALSARANGKERNRSHPVKRAAECMLRNPGNEHTCVQAPQEWWRGMRVRGTLC